MPTNKSSLAISMSCEKTQTGLYVRSVFFVGFQKKLSVLRRLRFRSDL